jgi:hypothetical protein
MQNCNSLLRGEMKDEVYDYGITQFMNAQDKLLKGGDEPGDKCGCN